MNPIFVLSDGCSPTEDLYFKSVVCKQLIERRGTQIRWVNCKIRRADKFFQNLPEKSTFIFFRTLPLSWIDRILKHKHRTGKIIYVLDDDLRAAASTPELPSAYRSRIGLFAEQYMDTLLDVSNQLVVCSEHLSKEYAEYQPSILHPIMTADINKKPDFLSGAPSIFYHATGSHKDDLALLELSLLNILDSNKCSFESLIGDLTPPSLCSHRKVRVRNQKSWREFKLFQRLSKRHIGLAPLLDTPYNRGKSHIKFLDISAVGAVGIYSNRTPYSSLVSHGVDGFLAEDDPEQWTEYISYLIQNPGVASKMAEKAREKAKSIGHPKHAYRFWLKLLST